MPKLNSKSRMHVHWDHFSIIMSNIQYKKREVELYFWMCLVKSLKREKIIQIQTGTLSERQCAMQIPKNQLQSKSVTLSRPPSLSLSSIVPLPVGMRWAEQLSVFCFSTRVKLISHFVTFYTLAHLCHTRLGLPVTRHPSFYSHSRRMPPEAHWNS